MTYLTFEEQVRSHLEFLNNNDLSVDCLEINGEFVRCKSTQKEKIEHGDYTYKTIQNQIENNLTDLVIITRGPSGV